MTKMTQISSPSKFVDNSNPQFVDFDQDCDKLTSGRPGKKNNVEFFPYFFLIVEQSFLRPGPQSLSYPTSQQNLCRLWTVPELGTTILFGSSLWYSHFSATCLNPAQ